MGDRANVVVKDQGHEVYLYTHWGGHRLAKTVQDALSRSEGRWDDSQYLARVIFCEMIKDDVMGTTGYGITARAWDGASRLIHIDPDNGTVFYNGDEWTFQEFVALDELPSF